MKANEERQPLVGKSNVRKRTLGMLSLVAIMYFSVAGGPEGTETMVKTGGPLPTFVGIFVLAVSFAVPLSLMTTELSTAFPENGGFVLWGKAAFGDVAGGMAGWLQFCFSAVDTALYPGLFVAYLAQTTRIEYSWLVSWLLQALFVFAITVLNLGGIDSVGHGSTLMMLLLLLPFATIVLLAFTGMFTGTAITGWEFNMANWGGISSTPDWPKFVLVLLWNMGMWETTSVCAGEVADVGKTFPPALAVTVVLVVLNYVLPIAAFTAMDNKYAAYNNGYYITIMERVGGSGWRTWLGISQCISVAGLFTNGVVKNAWMLCGMGEQGMLPVAIAHRLETTKSPWVAIMATLIVTVLMMCVGDFETVLGIDMMLYCLNLLLEIASLCWLRITEPDLKRDYRIPFQGIWLYLFFAPSVALCFYVIFSGGLTELLVTGTLLVTGLILLFLINIARTKAPNWFVGVDDVVKAEHHEHHSDADA